MMGEDQHRHLLQRGSCGNETILQESPYWFELSAAKITKTKLLSLVVVMLFEVGVLLTPVEEALVTNVLTAPEYSKRDKMPWLFAVLF